MQSPGLGRVCPEGSAIRRKTGERLYAPIAGLSVFRTGTRRHSEPLVFAKADSKALYDECQGALHPLNIAEIELTNVPAPGRRITPAGVESSPRAAQERAGKYENLR
jgi:hypothetical protein